MDSREKKGQSGINGKVRCSERQKGCGLGTMEVDRVALAVNTVGTSKIKQTKKDRVNKVSSHEKIR